LALFSLSFIPFSPSLPPSLSFSLFSNNNNNSTSINYFILGLFKTLLGCIYYFEQVLFNDLVGDIGAFRIRQLPTK
jgi:hypothetical protein